MTFVNGLLVGAIAGAANAALFSRFRPSERGTPLAVFLAIAAGIYLGFGLQDGRPAHAAIQTLGALPFVVVAVLWPRAVGLMGVAWLAHGAWDAVHQLGLVQTRIPSWYPGACMGLDLVLGASAVAWGRGLRSSGAPPTTDR